MIDLYTWTTPNGRKISIALEEMGLEYQTHLIDIRKGDQHAPDFLKISPNNKLPALVDGDISVFESGAILIYLAEKTDLFAPAKDSQQYWDMMSWLMWQKSGFGPMLGQTHHFLTYHEGQSEFAAAHFTKETARLYSVLDRQLADHEFIIDQLTIADFAIFPWVARFDRQHVDVSQYTNVHRWYNMLAKRPAFIKGYAQPIKVEEIPVIG